MRFGHSFFVNYSFIKIKRYESSRKNQKAARTKERRECNR